ncbi:MAG: YqgE/AlgH family protein [Bacteroidetes bacterium]|nr:YqgE/AlgH family protein [Bacteroidota bacterium]
MPISQGEILVARPLLNDGSFKRTVILLAEHTPQGTLGFILNKSMFLTLKDVVQSAQGLSIPIYYGGPVAENQLFYVHTVGHLISESVHIQQNYYWGGNFLELVEALKTKQINTEQVRFFIGYSGWSAGQLEEEIQQRAWAKLNSFTQNLINAHPNDIWPEQLARLGSNYKVLAHISEEPSMN